jgi:hypothetical protein
MFRQGYIGAVLTDDSKKALRKYARYPQVFCHHVTMAFAPTEEIWGKYQHLLGKEITIEVDGSATDEKCQVFCVTGIPSENVHPHITVSTQLKVAPAYSNKLIATAVEQNNLVPLSLKLQGIVTWISFKPHNKKL